jgi:hypothetical protein
MGASGSKYPHHHHEDQDDQAQSIRVLIQYIHSIVNQLSKQNAVSVDLNKVKMNIPLNFLQQIPLFVLMM